MTNLQKIEQKILNNQTLLQALETWRNLNYKIVFTNGCFDLLHKGHVDYLSKASDLGDVLIVGLNSDSSVKRLKGADRPILDETSRAIILASFSFITAVVLFSEDTPLNLIKKIQPDILVKGADYKPEDIVGYDIVMAKGGTISTLDYLPGCSTTEIINKIKG